MDKYVRKSQTLYSAMMTFCVIISIFLLVISTYMGYGFCNVIVIVILIIGLIFHILHVQHMKRSLLLLIEMSQSIVDQKGQSLPVIDGESYISVLSSHLHLLNIRNQSMIQTLHQEKKKLKDYIEDISHQMKTPLTAICLKEDILLEMSQGKQKQYVEQIIFQTQKIQYCIESLLHLAKVESQSVQYRKKEYLFEDIINSVEENLEPLLQFYHVKINSQGLNEIIYCDFQWFSEALKNIIKNSIEQKENSTIDITCVSKKSYLEINIQDYGDGFNHEDLSHLFERFYRSQNQEKSQGIGIGLSISKGIIDGHHGSIHALNHNGALFVINLPHKIVKNKYTVTDE